MFFLSPGRYISCSASHIKSKSGVRVGNGKVTGDIGVANINWSKDGCGRIEYLELNHELFSKIK